MTDVTLIVRSADERTAASCADLLKGLWPGHAVHVVRERPFSAALRRTFEVALEANRTWTLCIDADVLVSGALPDLIELARSQEEHVFQVQGLVLDKFIRCFRPAGNHLYRTALMERAMPFIPEEGTSLRPETDMLTAMAQRGYPWMQCDVRVGLHDFEQQYHDIFRKCFLHAHKHDWLHDVLRTLWSERAQNDPDYRVALLAHGHGLGHRETVFVDRDFLRTQIEQILREEGIEPKPALAGPEVLGLADAAIERFASELERSETLRAFQENAFPKRLWNRMVRDRP